MRQNLIKSNLKSSATIVEKGDVSRESVEHQPQFIKILRLFPQENSSPQYKRKTEERAWAGLA